MLTTTLAALRPGRLFREHPGIMFAVTILLMALVGGGLFARSALQSGPPPAVLPGQTLALEIATTATQAQGVKLASGAYAQGDGIILYSQVDQADRNVVRAWVVNQLQPFADRLAKLPEKEKLTWVIDYGPNQEIIQAPIRRAGDPAQQRYLGAAPGLITLPSADLKPTADPAAAQPNADPAAAEPTKAPDAPAPTNAPAAVAAEPTKAPDAPAPTKAPDAPAPTNAPAAVAADPTKAPDAPAPTAALETAPTKAPDAAASTKAPDAAGNALPTPAITVIPPPAGGVYGAPQQVGVVANQPFDAGSTGWAPLSGNWATADGTYVQDNLGGYDFISVLNVPPSSHFSLSAKIKLVDGTMGGGFIYNMPDPTKRNGAQIIDFSDKGGTLRFGRYNDKGDYVYVGAVAVKPTVMDGQWHTLQLITHAVTTTVTLDGKPAGKVKNTSLGGYIGLTTSQAKVAFDDVRLIALPEGATPPTDLAAVPTAVAPTAAVPIGPTAALTATATVAPTATGPTPVATPGATAVPTTTADAPITALKEDFSSGRANGWQVLSGTWQVKDGSYEQNVTNGSDLGSISAFQSDAYTMTVRVRRIDGDMGAGLYFNMAKRDSKSRSQMLRYTGGGKSVQWGYFDDGGNFVFVGSASVPAGGDGQWHTFLLKVQNGTAAIDLDGKNLIRDLPLAYKSGYVGLLVSNSHVAFDDVSIAALKKDGTK